MNIATEWSCVKYLLAPMAFLCYAISMDIIAHRGMSGTYPENTININIDGLYNAEELSILTRDGNGLVGLDEPLAMELSALAKSMGYKFRVGKLSFFSGATDSSSAEKNS